MSGKHHFQQLIFSLKNWTRKDGKQSIFNSQYLPLFPIFNPHIHPICNLWTIKPTKVHLPTIYTTPNHASSPKKIVKLWTNNKSYKKSVLVRNKR